MQAMPICGVIVLKSHGLKSEKVEVILWRLYVDIQSYFAVPETGAVARALQER